MMSKSRDPEHDLKMLRARLGLYPEIPAISEAHVLMLGGSKESKVLALCLHDDANECSHQMAYDLGEREIEDVLGADMEIKTEVMVECIQSLTAAYN